MRPFHLIIKKKRKTKFLFDHQLSKLLLIIPPFRHRGTYTCNVNETLKTFSRYSAFGQKKKKKKNFEFSLKTFGGVLCPLLDKERLNFFSSSLFPTCYTCMEGREEKDARKVDIFFLGRDRSRVGERCRGKNEFERRAHF